MKLNISNINIKEFIQNILTQFQPLTKKANIDLIFKSEKQTISGYLDVKQVKKVLFNLLSNAIKYNKVGGEIIVSVDGSSFSVEDSGIGIAENDISKIQNRYTRFNKSSGGFGIGLSIVSTIAEEYNLKIDITSQERVGTKVSISW